MTETAIAPPPALFRTDDDGVMHWFPHEFQVQARASLAARTFILKGWRGGWTSWSAKILETEMKRCGPGNLNLSYFAISPTHKVAEKGLIPAIQTVFCTHMGYAHYNKNEKTFIITPEGERALWGHAQKEPTKIVCCYAEDPESFASMTAISGVADEVGQKKFKYESWSTLEARCATTSGMTAPNNTALGFPRDLKMGRIFAGSTVYQLNWLEDLWNQWVAAMRKAETAKNQAIAVTSDPQEQAEIEQEYRRKAYLGQIDPVNNFIRFDSTANPLISKEFFDGKRRSLQKWFFDMRYRAIFRKPAGVIFEEWNAQKHVISPREGLGRYVARRWKKWPRDIYIDFGKRNFHAQLWVIDEERNRFFLIASYHDSHLTNIERAKLLVDAWGIPERCVAGQISEDEGRAELTAGGLVAVAPAYKDLWTGINNMASAIKQNRIFVFDDMSYSGMPALLNDGFRVGSKWFRDEVRTYSRPVDEKGEVELDKEPEDKDSYHSVDCLRIGLTYRFSYLSASDMTPRTGPGRAAARETAPAPESEAMMIRAGGGGSGFMDSIADRYGMGYDTRQPYIDIDL